MTEMDVNDPTARASFKRAAHDAVDAAFERLPPAELDALEEWLNAVDAWEAGEPPLPPATAWRLLTS